MSMKRDDIRLALPSKGRIAEGTMSFLDAAGLKVHKPNPRQFEARIPALPGLTVLYQRAGDIVVSARDGSVDFGITGWDVVCERRGDEGALLTLHGELGYSHCTLNVIVPETWSQVHTMPDLKTHQTNLDRPLRVATKFPNLTREFLVEHGIEAARLIDAEGTLEAAPAIGYADCIVDLVSTGTTLRDNRLRRLEDGEILRSQACLIANRAALRLEPKTLAMAKSLLEYIEAHLRAATHVAIFANMRGESPEAIAEKMFAKSVIGGLQGPTVSPVVTRSGGRWYAVHIIVARDRLSEAISELREIGGSGVVVGPVTYIFEEEPEAYLAMLRALEEWRHHDEDI
jgi:ATP phosphoribosyltransferase